MPTTWRIELLGTFRAHRDDIFVSHFRTRRVAALLAYLAYYPNRSHPRIELAEILWPEQDSEIGRRNLRQALSSLRLAFPTSPGEDSFIRTFQDSVALDSQAITTDVAEFEQLALQAARETDSAARSDLLFRAIRLYPGDLLPGFAEDWVFSERLRLEDLFLSALRSAVANLRAEHSAEAANYLRLGLAKEPLNEEWHAALMEINIESGQPDRAISQAEHLRDLLDDEFGDQPSERILTLERKALKLREGRIGRSSSRVRVSLPVPLTKLYGREAENQEIFSKLRRDGRRLLTITGAAGVGKTRMALEVGRLFRELGDWNVWFVSAADCTDANCLIDSIIGAIDPHDATSETPMAQIEDRVGPGDSLLILDNVEQMVSGAADVVGQLLHASPNLRLLLTTRQRLEMAGEFVYVAAPLPSPVVGKLDASLRDNPSVALFLDRCQANGQLVGVSETDLAKVATLCAKLEGVPLALEIIAGLCNTFSPDQIMKRLPVRLTEVSSSRRDVPDRHRSLQDAIDYGVQALDPELRKFFIQLAVFQGDFSVEIAHEVSYLNSFEDSRSIQGCLDSILALRRRSLIETVPNSGLEPRFRLLNASREFAEHLLAPGELDRLRRRHADFYVSRSPAEDQNLTAATQAERNSWIDADYPNFIAAIEYCYGEGRFEACVQLLSALSLRGFTRGPRAVEREYIRRLAAEEGFREAPPYAQVRLLRMLGTTFIRTSEYARAYEACRRAVDIAAATGDDELTAVSLSGLSICAGYLGKMEECADLNSKVLELASEKSYRLRERSYLGLGSVYWNLGNLVEAEKAFLEAKRCSEFSLDGEPDVLILINLARVALDMGKFEESLKIVSEAMRLSSKLNDDLGMAFCLTILSRRHWLRGEIESALSTNLQALTKSLEGDFSFWILHCVRASGLILADRGWFEEATSLLAASYDVGKMSRSSDNEDYVRCLSKIQSALTPSQFESAWSLGLTLDRDQACRLAVASTNQFLSRELAG